VNVKSVYLTARHLAGAMRTRRSGAILNIASTGGVSPRPNLTWYNASKGWMIAATRAMAAELAPFGVRVNAINPVAGDTPLLATFMGTDTPEARARIVSTIPMGRLSTPTDIGAAAAFLCSDDAALITGVAMEVDGGRCL
jgi:3-oxoacyl-[acyl-carrier protein] reductase